MNDKRIDILLEKYWNCETSVLEEQELQAYFNSSNISDELRPLAPMFSYKQHQQSLSLSDDFERKLNESIRQAERKSKYITIKIFEPLLRIAASVVLILGIGISVYLFAKRDNQVFAETYNDPHIAVQQAALALEKLSSALQTSEEASLKSLEQLDNLDLDWSKIDSLSAVLPLYVPEPNNDTELDTEFNDL